MIDIKQPPTLRVDIQWLENYISAAINEKWAGILPVGVYAGFSVKPAVGLSVTVFCPDAEKLNVAGVGVGRYWLSCRMDKSEYVTLNVEKGKTQYVVLVVDYSANSTTSVHLSVSDNVPENGIWLAKVTLSSSANSVTNSDIELAPHVSFETGDIEAIVDDEVKKFIDALTVNASAPIRINKSGKLAQTPTLSIDSAAINKTGARVLTNSWNSNREDQNITPKALSAAIDEFNRQATSQRAQRQAQQNEVNYLETVAMIRFLSGDEKQAKELSKAAESLRKKYKIDEQELKDFE